ncbi:hypothetical protein T484DRAFT_1880081, partial [Baffinella frigidus]
MDTEEEWANGGGDEGELSSSSSESGQASTQADSPNSQNPAEAQVKDGKSVARRGSVMDVARRGSAKDGFARKPDTNSERWTEKGTPAAAGGGRARKLLPTLALHELKPAMTVEIDATPSYTLPSIQTPGRSLGGRRGRRGGGRPSGAQTERAFMRIGSAAERLRANARTAANAERVPFWRQDETNNGSPSSKGNQTTRHRP